MSEVVADAVWVEKYRPKTLSEMVGQETIVPLLSAYATKKTLPHLLFAGPPGTGKTTAALAFARDVFGESWRDSFLELNASDERGIETVRTTIKSYARSAPLGGIGFKLLFLDEADNLTPEAQASLRRMMERYSAGCRFILSCNYASKIIDPIQSRCAVFRFRPYSPESVRTQIERIAKAERKTIDRDAVDAIVDASTGDLRRATNLLQLAATYADHVTKSTVESTATVPLRTEVESVLREAIGGNFFRARERLFAIFVERGASGEDVVRALHSYLPDLPSSLLSDTEKVDLIELLGEIDFRLAQGATDRIQLEAVLAHVAKHRAPSTSR